MKSIIASLFLLIPIYSLADILPQGLGIIYGKDHVFSLTAPKGWVLDNESAVNSGVHAVFYEEGGSWANSKVVAYARSRPINKNIKTVKDAVDFLLLDFHKNGSPNYKGKKIKEIKTDSGEKGVIYHFTGDQWGNYEAACYFKEEKTINMVILTSRDKELFDTALSTFESLCKSYIYINDHYVQKPKGKQDIANNPAPTK